MLFVQAMPGFIIARWVGMAMIFLLYFQLGVAVSSLNNAQQTGCRAPASLPDFSICISLSLLVHFHLYLYSM